MLNPENYLILAIDDQKNNLQVLQYLLDAVGYQVTFATSGEQALKRIAIVRPDLILLDLMMPEIDGLQLCEMLKSNPDLATLPIIFLTASNEQEDLLQAFQRGAVDYVTKPFNKYELLARIKTHLELNYLREQAQKKAEQEKIINSITGSIHDSLNVNETLSTVSHQLKDFFTADRVVIIGCDPQLKCSIIAHSTVSDLPPSFQANFVDIEWLKNQNQSGLSVYNWSRETTTASPIPETHQDWLQTHPIKAELLAPIYLESHLWGVLVAHRYQRDNPWTEDDTGILLRIVDQLAIAVQQSELYQQLQKANKALCLLANTDGLTQIANRRRFDDLFSQEWQRLQREKAPLSLVLCDIDYFKQYNDFYGHLQGDICLKQVAQTLAEAIKRPADLVARYGGEEFAIVLPNTDLNGAIAIAQMIQDKLAQLKIPHAKSLGHTEVTLSLGINSIIPTPNSSPNQFIENTDQALYQAKQNGRNQYAIASTVGL